MCQLGQAMDVSCQIFKARLVLQSSESAADTHCDPAPGPRPSRSGSGRGFHRAA